jgi:raffinose/stachyose/melibiose transport system substrate-binding protein
MATSKLRQGRAARRGLAALSAIALIGIVAGCSSTASTSTTGSTAAPSGTLNIVVSSADASDAAFKAVNSAFEAKYPKVKVQFSAIPNNNYTAAKSSRLTAGNVDILIAAPTTVPKYVTTDSASDDSRAADAGVFLDLSAEPFMKNFTPTLLKAIAYKGKQYTVPTGVSYYTGVYYNKTMFDKLGLTIPTTWSEFVTLCDTLQKKGVSPLGIGGKDSWPAGLTMISAVQGLYPTQADKESLAQDLWQKKVTLTDSKTETVLDRVKQIYGFAEPNFAGVSYAAVPAGFAAEQYAMTPDGTWDQPVIASAVGSKFSYGYFPIPTSDTAADNKYLGGKVDLRLAIASATKNKAAALAYLGFFSDPKNYATYVKISGTAPAEQNIPTSAFLDSIKNYTSTFSPAWDTLWIANSKAGATAVFPFNYPGIAPLGTGTVATAAKQSQSDWAAGF